MKIKALLLNPFLHIAIISVLAFLSYGRILGSYFLADDFGEIKYISEIFNGDINLLISNFTGNYMQIPSMAVYRPWLLMSLAIDYGIWHTNAFGYYLTNLVHYLSCAILIYLILRRLTDYWGALRSSLAGIFAAMIFALNPLHCESISWVVGRVDIVCLSFYLLGLYLISVYLDSKSRSCLIGSTLCFWFAIFTKEMAIGLPVIATVMAFLFATKSNAKSEEPLVATKNTESTSKTLKENLQEAFNEAKPVFIAFTICTIIYFTIRYLALGTFTGGYTGSIGASQFSNILTKWLDPDSFTRILFPFNHTLMLDGGIYRKILSLAYFLVASLAFMRMLIGTWPKRLSLFILIWLLTALAPIYQLYGLGYNLEGMRFLFFATAPLSILIPVILFAPWSKSTEPKHGNKVSILAKRELPVSILACSLIVLVFAKTSYINNSPWIEAGRQTRAVALQVLDIAKNTKPQEQVALLGIPKENAGSHMILNGPTLSFLLEPPFTKTDMTEKVVSFEPILYGDENLINLQHFKQALSNSRIEKFMVWQFEKRRFQEIPIKDRHDNHETNLDIAIGGQDRQNTNTPLLLPHSVKRQYKTSLPAEGGGLSFHNAIGGIGIEIAPLDIEPLKVDFLNLQVKESDLAKIQGKNIGVSWSGLKNDKETNSKKLQTNIQARFLSKEKNDIELLIPLSIFWSWNTYSKVSHIYLNFPPQEYLTITKANLVSLNQAAPSIEVISPEPEAYGTYKLKNNECITIKVKPIEQSDHAIVQIARNNFFFENFKGDKLDQFIWKTIKLNSLSEPCIIKVNDFQGSGYNQIRVQCFDKLDRPVGTSSYPITIEIPD